MPAGKNRFATCITFLHPVIKCVGMEMHPHTLQVFVIELWLRFETEKHESSQSYYWLIYSHKGKGSCKGKGRLKVKATEED